jgi:hypothetical protein
MEEKNGNGKQEEQKEKVADEQQPEAEQKAEVQPTAETEQKAPEKVVPNNNGRKTEKKTGPKAEKKAGKKPEAKTERGVVAFEKKPIPDAVKGIVESIEKVTDLENLKAVARVLKKHWKKVYVEACKKATEDLKAGNVVWFKRGSKLIAGKVVKVKSSGKVKIDGEDGKIWRVPGTMLHKGRPTAAERAEVTGSTVTKKAA